MSISETLGSKAGAAQSGGKKYGKPKTMASSDAKIEKAQTTVEKTKARYDAAITELETLYAEKRDLQAKELAVAIKKSGKSYEDALNFVQSGKR